MTFIPSILTASYFLFHCLKGIFIYIYMYTDKFYYVSNLINLYKKETHHIGSVDQIRNIYQGSNN